MIWDRSKFRSGIQHIPSNLFSKDNICPICNKKIIPEEEKFINTDSIPYIRVFDKFYKVHKECFFLLYEGISETIELNLEEFTAYRL